MIETKQWTPAGGSPRPMYVCTECGAEIDGTRVKKDDPNWHRYDCSIQVKAREAKELLDRFLIVKDHFPLIEFIVIDPREMGYSEDPAEVQKLIDAMAAEIKRKLCEER